MKEEFNYKGFKGSCEYSKEDICFYGKLIGINDLVNYESGNVSKLRKEFENAVDDYLIMCKEINKTPEKVV